MASKNTNSDWSVSVRDLIHRPGEMRELQFEVALREQYGEGLLWVPELAVVAIEVKIESVHEGLWVSGTASADAQGECARCLAPIRDSIEVDFNELFAYENSEGFEYLVQDEHVYLEPIVRDAIVLSLPFNPVCPDGCEKPELTGEISVNFAGEDQPERLDPRWAKLAEFSDKNETP